MLCGAWPTSSPERDVDPATVLTAAKIARRVPWTRLIAAVVVVGVAMVLFVGGAVTTLLGTPVTDGLETAAPCSVNAVPEQKVGALDAAQTANAATIIRVGQRLGLPERAWVIALATARQESTLRADLDESESDRDSAGLFQQRRHWGTLGERMDAATSAEMFYTGGRNGPSERGLEDINGWESMPVTAAAQAVQVSAFPNAYARWETLARGLVADLAGGTAPAVPAGFTDAQNRCATDALPASFTPLAGATEGEAAVNAAARWLGLPYAWGGGTINGPSESIRSNETQIGFDCSGLVLHAWYQANGTQLPHSAAAIAAGTTPVPTSQVQAGDILSFSDGGRITHDGLYDGRGGMVHAPRTGDVVKLTPNILTDPYWSGRLVSITRP